MNDSPAIQAIQDMIEEDLILAFDHLQEGQEDLALHQIDNAREKILQIKEFKQPTPAGGSLASLKQLAVNAETSPELPLNATHGPSTSAERNR